MPLWVNFLPFVLYYVYIIYVLSVKLSDYCFNLAFDWLSTFLLFFELIYWADICIFLFSVVIVQFKNHWGEFSMKTTKTLALFLDELCLGIFSYKTWKCSLLKWGKTLEHCFPGFTNYYWDTWGLLLNHKTMSSHGFIEHFYFCS